MKKVFLFVVTALLMVSCGEELEFNTPALQGKKDGALWRADYYSAEINSSGELIISGGRGSEIVTLRMGAAVGTYVLGEGSSSEAGFTSVQDIAYSTNNEPSEIIQIYPADGEIVIEKYSASGSKVSGTFWFNAFSASGLNKVNYSQGVFYEVPVSGGGTGGAVVVSCDDAVIATGIAGTNYAAADMADANYASVCNAYEAALMQQITSCGDDTNTLQAIMDGLDCGAVVITPGVCQTCTGGGLPSATYCDNGNGTMDITTNGTTTTTSLNGFDFDFYIQALVTSGATCN